MMVNSIDKKGVGVDYPGPGNVPVRLLCNNKMLFMRAELAQASVSSEDPKAMF